MNPRIIAACALLLLPSLASAQRRSTRGTQSPNWDQLSRSGPPLALTRREVEEMDPVRRLLEKRKDLRLTDGQIARLKELEGAAKTRDEALLQVVDSLRKEMRPNSSGMDDVQRLRMQAMRQQLKDAVATIRANYAVEAKEAVQALEEGQRPTAEALLSEQVAEADETLQKKLGGGSPRGETPRAPPA